MLLECAKHTIPDDWSLGMAYLLSLNKDHVVDAQEILLDLPRGQLYTQTALYYYSLELYKTLYTDDCEKLYLYKPVDLIRHTMLAAETATEESEIVRALRYWQNRLHDEAQIAETEQQEEEQTVADRKEESIETRDYVDDNIAVTSPDVSEGQRKAALPDEIDTAEWTDDWGDFSEDDTEATSDRKDNTRSGELEDETVSLDRSIIECVTEEDRLAAFQVLFSRMDNLEDYAELKKMVSQWPKFSVSDDVALNPVLRMMKAIIPLIGKTNAVDLENGILREHEQLIKLLISKEVRYTLLILSISFMASAT